MPDRYTPNKPLSCDQLFDGQLASYGLAELPSAASSPSKRALTDGLSVLWIHRQSDGTATASSNEWDDVARILSAIEDRFGVKWDLNDV